MNFKVYVKNDLVYLVFKDEMDCEDYCTAVYGYRQPLPKGHRLTCFGGFMNALEIKPEKTSD